MVLHNLFGGIKNILNRGNTTQDTNSMTTKNKLKWKTEQRRINDLVPYEFNPRQMSTKEVDALKESLEEFDLVEIPAVDTDNTIIAGHQRIMILMLEGRGEEEIDVRVPNRKLTDDEFRRYNIKSNLIHGSWNIDILAAHFGVDFLKAVGFSDEFMAKIITPDFKPVAGGDRLDKKEVKQVECPKCGHMFDV